MYKVLTVVCVVAIIALGTSVISAIIQNSTTTRQSDQISSLSRDVATDRHEMSVLRTELHRNQAHQHPKRAAEAHDLRTHRDRKHLTNVGQNARARSAG
jgi:hypothetical protein